MSTPHAKTNMKDARNRNRRVIVEVRFGLIQKNELRRFIAPRTDARTRLKLNCSITAAAAEAPAAPEALEWFSLDGGR